MRDRGAAWLAAAGAALLLGGPGPAEGAFEGESPPPVLLKDGTLLTMAGEPVEGGSVLLRGGKIEAVGRDVPAPPGVRVVDCAGRLVTPGLIDGGTQVGLLDIDLVKSANDSDEGAVPSAPDLDVRDGVNVESPVFAVTRSHGVTTVLVAPQEGDVINGQGALLHCVDGPLAAKTVLAPSGLHVSFGEPPKARFGPKNQQPQTRMGLAALLRRELDRARDYLEKKRRYEEKKAAPPKEGEKPSIPDPPAVDRGLEVLGKVLRGDLPVFARAERLDDIRTALRIGEEYRLRLVLVRATEAWKIAGELAAKQVPVVYGPVTTMPQSMETLGARMDAPAILQRAGVLFCLMTGGAHNARNLPYHAGIAVSYGLPRDAAHRAITRDAARILGVGDRLGTLEPGKEATVVVFDGDPLEPLSKVVAMFVRGQEVSLRSRQTELNEKWK